MSTSATTTETGTIITLRIVRGFGFISPDQPGPDLFFHRSQLVPELDSTSCSWNAGSNSPA